MYITKRPSYFRPYRKSEDLKLCLGLTYWNVQVLNASLPIVLHDFLNLKMAANAA